MKAYGAVVYLKQGDSVAFVISKSRVKPLKSITLPRLELLAAVVGTQLLKLVLKALGSINIQHTTLWCDSQIVLCWIQSGKKLPIFVENRVKTIREGHFTFTKYCPTKDNPSDMLTRGLAHNEYLNHSVLWLKGPPWLPEGDRPICELFDSAVLACEIDNDMPTSTTCENQICGISSIINITDFNSLDRLLRVTSYILRFTRRQKSTLRNSVHISVPELNRAKRLWVMSVQRETYSNELQTMKRQTIVKNSLVNQLKIIY